MRFVSVLRVMRANAANLRWVKLSALAGALLQLGFVFFAVFAVS